MEDYFHSLSSLLTRSLVLRMEVKKMRRLVFIVVVVFFVLSSRVSGADPGPGAPAVMRPGATDSNVTPAGGYPGSKQTVVQPAENSAKQLIGQLESHDPEGRKKALAGLTGVRYSEKARREVEKLLFTEPRAEIRQQAVMLLGQMEQEDSLLALKRAGEKEPVPEVRTQIESVVRKIEKKICLGRLESRNKRIRLQGIDDLKGMNHSPAWVVTQLLRQGRFDPNPEVRQAAVEVLGNLGAAAKDAVVELEAALADPVEDVAKTVAWAIDRIKVAVGLELLNSDDAEKRKQGVGIWIDVASRYALGVGRLAHWLRSDPDPEVREVIAKALGDIGKPGAVEALRKAMVEDVNPVVRLKAEEAIWRIEHPSEEEQ